MTTSTSTNKGNGISIAAIIFGSISLGLMALSGLFIASLIFIVLALLTVPAAGLLAVTGVILGIIALVRGTSHKTRAILAIILSGVTLISIGGIIAFAVGSNLQSSERAKQSQTIMNEIDAYQAENGVFPSYDEITPLLTEKHLLPKNFGTQDSNNARNEYYYQLTCKDSSDRSTIILAKSYDDVIVKAQIYYISGHGEGTIYDSVVSSASVPFYTQGIEDCANGYYDN